MCFENADRFTKLHVFINEVLGPLKFDGTKRLTYHSFLHTLTTKTVPQIFDKCVCYSLQGVNFKKEKKIGLPTKTRHKLED